jgi:peptidyl-prolyl cis-trans isomerase A (cyclophilin A)
MVWAVLAGWLSLVGCTDHELVAERDALASRVQALEGDKTAMEGELRKVKGDLERALADNLAAKKAADDKKVDEALKTLGIARGQKLRAELVTTAGSIGCELWPEVAPRTVTNFVGLSEGTIEWTDPRTREKRKDPLYNGTIFHRVIPGFMIQGGDPKGDGTGGPGYRFEDEVHADVRFDQPMLLAMANAGPGTNGSQFFITVSKPKHLNGKHTIFGKCENPDVVEKIVGAPRGRNDFPDKPVSIEKVVVTRG